ncbi:hypothetical protein NC653_037437 [Populus alba x Populus x berolinensis]|uniref:Uncharacterized protein n=1 Tax=Populus alba x Populus x berolinensis TaxID=444605 RepID=A0AAD6LGY6_9ROSI|nr:hypothetical protein NC653_037437 [Populus alba x Populus x berolinensis]
MFYFANSKLCFTWCCISMNRTISLPVLADIDLWLVVPLLDLVVSDG